MAKDPAVLFYTQDFLLGTSLMTAEEKGHYITLLCYQQQYGSLSMIQIQKMMGADFERLWPEISGKFQIDEAGKFFNVKMKKEVDRRAQYSKKQSDRVKHRYHGRTTVDTTVLPIIETEIETETTSLKGVRGNFSYDLKTKLPEQVLEAAEISQNTYTNEKNTEFIKCQWKVFLSERMNDPPNKKHLTLPDLTSHFLNWIRNKHPKNGTVKQINGSSGQPIGTSEARMRKARDW